MWMPWHAALERAGGFEALVPPLRAGRILARHAGLYKWPEGWKASGPGDIHRDWWNDAFIDPDTGRVILTRDLSSMIAGPGPSIPHRVFAIGIEVERETFEAIFPAANPPPAQAIISAWNSDRDAAQEAKWTQWQAAADRIGKAHPLWSKHDVAVQVKKNLRVVESADTIRKRIKKTW
jgi:hypothetical protein